MRPCRSWITYHKDDPTARNVCIFCGLRRESGNMHRIEDILTFRNSSLHFVLVMCTQVCQHDPRASRDRSGPITPNLGSHAGAAVLSELAERTGLTDGLSEAVADCGISWHADDPDVVLAHLAVAIAAEPTASMTSTRLGNSPRCSQRSRR
jgi:hypothetical protein